MKTKTKVSSTKVSPTKVPSVKVSSTKVPPMKMPPMKISSTKVPSKSISSFPLKFTINKRDPEERQVNNILQREPGEYAQNSIETLISKVDTGTNVNFSSAKDRYKTLKTMFDPAKFPKSEVIELGLLVSDEDIQRELDVAHATTIYAYFDEQRVQPIQVVKTPGKEEYTIVNGQHTVSVVALIVASGLMKGCKAKDWKKFKVLVAYIETHDRSKARETFALLNGEMSKEITKFDHWKQHYLSVRLDGSGNPKYLHTYAIIEMLKKYNCIPLPVGHADVGLAGAVTHLANIETAAKNENYERLEFILSNRDAFWNDLPMDSSESLFYGSLFDMVEDEGISRNTVEWQSFMMDIHAIVQKVFKGMQGLKLSKANSYKKYRYDLFFDKNAAAPSSVDLYIVYKIYKAMGGTFDIAPLNNMYVHKKLDVLNYLTESELTFINSHLPAKSKIKPITVTLPGKKIK